MAKVTKVSMMNDGGILVGYESGRSKEYSFGSLPKGAMEFIEKDPQIKAEFEAARAEYIKEREEQAKRMVSRSLERFESPFFKSLADETIFYLTVMDGERKVDYLGITVLQYSDRIEALMWRKKVMMIIEGSENPMLGKAIAEVDRISKNMGLTDEDINGNNFRVLDINSPEAADLIIEVEYMVNSETAEVVTFGETEIDTIMTYRTEGAEALETKLSVLSAQELKDVIRKNGLDTFRQTGRWRKKERLIGFIMDRTKARATMGEVFRNYAR